MQTLSRLGLSAASQPVHYSAGTTFSKSSSCPLRSNSCPVKVAQPQKTALLDELRETSSLDTDAAQQSRRSVAFGGLLSLGSLFLLPGLPAQASILRSQRSDRPCALTVQNNGLRPVKLFWINYDGETMYGNGNKSCVYVH